MKAAFVVGFFNSVEKALQIEFNRELDGGTLVVLGISSPRHPFNLKKFKSQFFEATSRNDQDPILVIAADMRNPELAWVKPSVEGIVESGRGDGREIRLVFFPDAQNSDPVVEALHEFQLRGPAENCPVTEETLLAHRKGKKVLCIRGEKQSNFEEALRRAGFQFVRFEDHFVEVDLTYGPNVGQVLINYAKHHVCLLYAWGELKYAQPAIKKKWEAFYQGTTPADAVARFKQAVLGS